MEDKFRLFFELLEQQRFSWIASHFSQIVFMSNVKLTCSSSSNEESFPFLGLWIGIWRSCLLWCASSWNAIRWVVEVIYPEYGWRNLQSFRSDWKKTHFFDLAIDVSDNNVSASQHKLYSIQCPNSLAITFACFCPVRLWCPNANSVLGWWLYHGSYYEQNLMSLNQRCDKLTLVGSFCCKQVLLKKFNILRWISIFSCHSFEFCKQQRRTFEVVPQSSWFAKSTGELKKITGVSKQLNMYKPMRP